MNRNMTSKKSDLLRHRTGDEQVKNTILNAQRNIIGGLYYEQE